MTATAAPAADFSCAICFDTATEPVVTRCGHLFCWECLDHWLHSPSGAPECPVCKGRVDERIAGDIIPLYGKGRQAAGKPVSGLHTTAPTAATTASSTAAATAVDEGQQAFFSRPSAYSFVPVRETRRDATPPSDEEHHPRPTADRAPPRPRPPQQRQNMQMHVHTHGVPLTVGSSVFFFGGGGGMFLSIVLIIAWALYNYSPWREWSGDIARWYHRVRGGPVPEERRDGVASTAAPAANTGGSAPSATHTNSANTNQNVSSSAASTEAANGLPPQQVMVRNLILSLFAIFVLFQLLLFV